MRPEIQKLNNISTWLSGLCVQGCSATMTTNAADATERLNSASGFQIIASRPELSHSTVGNDYDAVVFVLAKGLGNGRTTAKEDQQYQQLLSLAADIVTNAVYLTEEATCQSALKGIALAGYNIVPVTSIFGGWLGWSIEFNFE